jgi:hypothetical protein
MRKLLPCLCLMLLAGSASFAQNRDYPKWDFTAAYTLNNMETPIPVSHPTLQGFTGAVGWNFRRYAAIEGDVTYTTKTVGGIRRSLLSYVVGPRFTRRFGNTWPHAQPFVHAIYGGGRLTGFGPATNGWVGKMGGGVDIIASKHVAIRAFQVDYYRYHGHVNVGRQRLDNMAFTFGLRFF